MLKKNKIKSNIIGLDIGLVFGRFFLNTEDLHFGCWHKNEKPSVQNFAQAQNNHSQLIIDSIPKKSCKILDVGSGSGNLALKLLNLGYKVDCVIPSKYLAKAVKEKIHNNGKIHICKFENLNSTELYDVIIFSESFQYVNMNTAFLKIQNILTNNGCLIICDFFKLTNIEKSLMGGGHNWDSFTNLISNTSLQQTANKDITDLTAPTIDFLNNFSQEVLKPISKMIGKYMFSNYPTLSKFLSWKFKNRLIKINNRYLSGNVNGESFKKFKTYRLLTYKLIK